MVDLEALPKAFMHIGSPQKGPSKTSPHMSMSTLSVVVYTAFTYRELMVNYQ